MYTENDLEEKRNWLFLQGLNARVISIYDAVRWYLKNVQIFESECILAGKIPRVKLQRKYK